MQLNISPLCGQTSWHVAINVTLSTIRLSIDFRSLEKGHAYCTAFFLPEKVFKCFVILKLCFRKNSTHMAFCGLSNCMIRFHCFPMSFTLNPSRRRRAPCVPTGNPIKFIQDFISTQWHKFRWADVSTWTHVIGAALSTMLRWSQAELPPLYLYNFLQFCSSGPATAHMYMRVP